MGGTKGEGNKQLVSDHDGVVVGEVVGWQLEVGWCRPPPRSSARVVVAAVAGAEEAAVVALVR